MQKSKIALAVASVLGASNFPLYAATCTANSDATLRACISNSAAGDIIYCNVVSYDTVKKLLM
jgi:hypothetical protein